LTIKCYIVSLDPAKLYDYCALSVLEISREAGEAYNQYRLIALERQRRQPYEITAAWFVKAFKNPMLRQDVTLPPIPLIDIGGVGEPTADIIKRMGVQVRGIRYTGGDGYAIVGRNVNVSKVLMVSTFLGISEGGRFVMPSRVSFEGLFKSELRDFRGELGKLGRIRFEAEEGSHDDLVMSVIQGVWFGEQFIKPRRSLKPPSLAVAYPNVLLDEANASLGSIAEQEPEMEPWLPNVLCRVIG